MCPDGKYRWVYELDMYKSSVIIKEVWRAMLIAGVIVLAFLFVINIMDNDLSWHFCLLSILWTTI